MKRISGSSLLTLAATGFGTGFSPFAPGTAASVLAMAMFLLAGHFAAWLRPAIGAVLIPVAFAGSAHGEKLWGHDPSRVTIDEVLGCWIACLLAPWTIQGSLLALALFRFFDILKPWPVSRLDRMKGAAGVVLDDVAAGLLSAAAIAIGRLVLDLL